MTCVSCEIIISEELKKIEGIHEVIVCHKKQTAEITFKDNETRLKKIIYKIKKLGYEASGEPFEKTIKTPKATKKQWLYAFLLVFFLYWVYRYFQWIGIFSWVDIEPNNIGYGAAFLVGIIASLSTCLAIIGTVVISFGTKYQTQGTTFEKNIKPHLLFHMGRITTFFLLGGLLGIVGNFFELSQSFMGWFTIIIAVVFAWLGLNILGILPSLSTVGFRMPKSSMRVWNRLKESEHALTPILLGGFTFFLPCGFTQSMQLFAMGSGNFWVGALTLTFFALGTAPVLFSLGVMTSKSKNKKRVILQKAIGFIIIAFAYFTLSSGLALAGISLNTPSTEGTEASVETDDVQIINMTVDFSGYSPSTIRIKKDIPVRWEINGKQLSGCTNEIIVPDLGIRKKLAPGNNVIDFTPKKTGTIGFSCWMGMVRGKFIVE